MPDFLSSSLFVLGAFVCGLNFYLSFLRLPLLRRGGDPEREVRNVSGIPLLGSALVLLALPAMQAVPGVVLIGIVLILIDTGGPHWFVGTIAFMALRGRSRNR